ncbi:signal peptidase II [uncultured Cloacibacillus sp.]|uniref:signal peptidase II n=1 Tax=uncultured Cloacibacillus sp. TaxID=889794 RepID=UPI0025E15D85|nr:signal peptidase II [uncultured Cloacibacillus sp.]
MLRAGRRRFYIFFALMLYAADAAVKRFVLASGCALSFNEGVSFGLFRNGEAEAAAVMNAAVLAVLLFAFARALRGNEGAGLCAPLALLAAGAAGNFTDRLVYGRVVDWLPLPCPFFGTLWINAADLWLIAGAGILVFRLFFPRGGRD